jgi:hypothetical protein
MHSDSVSSALDRRMAFSRIRERMTSALVGLDVESAGTIRGGLRLRAQ